MAHLGINLVGLDAGTIRDIFLEMFAIQEQQLTIRSSTERRSFIMKENLMAPLVSGPKMKMMEQKAFWMHVKMFSTL